MTGQHAVASEVTGQHALASEVTGQHAVASEVIGQLVVASVVPIALPGVSFPNHSASWWNQCPK